MTFDRFISFSITQELNDRINQFIKKSTKYSPSATIKMPHELREYYEYFPDFQRSKIIRDIVGTYLDRVIDVFKNRKVFISRSSLVRNALVYDLMKPIKERILTYHILRIFSYDLARIGLLYSDNIDSRKDRDIILGNIYHPNGTWRMYHKKSKIYKFEKFNRIYKKVETYFSQRYVSLYWDMFKKADKLGLLDDIKNESDLRRIYEL